MNTIFRETEHPIVAARTADFGGHYHARAAWPSCFLQQKPNFPLALGTEAATGGWERPGPPPRAPRAGRGPVQALPGNLPSQAPPSGSSLSRHLHRPPGWG